MTTPVSGAMIEALARAIHGEYVRAEQAAGRSELQNPSIVDWERLPEDLRLSNRDHAGRIAEKLGLIGCNLVPAGDASGREVVTHLYPDEVELLARHEHERWMAERLGAGWIHGPRKSVEARTHPDLIPYDDLDEAAKEKDRLLVRAIPSLLKAAGLVAVRDH